MVYLTGTIMGNIWKCYFSTYVLSTIRDDQEKKIISSDTSKTISQKARKILKKKIPFIYDEINYNISMLTSFERLWLLKICRRNPCVCCSVKRKEGYLYLTVTNNGYIEHDTFQIYVCSCSQTISHGLLDMEFATYPPSYSCKGTRCLACD